MKLRYLQFRVGNNESGTMNLKRLDDLQHMALLSDIARRYNTIQSVHGSPEAIMLRIVGDELEEVAQLAKAAGVDYIYRGV